MFAWNIYRTVRRPGDTRWIFFDPTFDVCWALLPFSLSMFILCPSMHTILNTFCCQPSVRIATRTAACACNQSTYDAMLINGSLCFSCSLPLLLSSFVVVVDSGGGDNGGIELYQYKRTHTCRPSICTTTSV